MTITRGLAEAVQKELKSDFVPNGPPVDIRSCVFRRLRDNEPVRQCCRRVSHDIQSGPIFCGCIADYLTELEDGEVALCERHRLPDNQII